MSDEKQALIHMSKKRIVYGQVVEETDLKVQGENLVECEEIFDRKWKK